MSLESYKRSIEAQREPEKEPSAPQREVVTEYVYVEQPKQRKRGFGRLITAIVIIAVIIIAAIKNPSATETKALVKNAVVEKVNEKMSTELMNDENDGFKRIGAFLGMTFAPNILDYFTNIEVSDYVVFSTFDCTVNVGDDTKTIVSGIVIFGKVIPLHSDLNTETLEFND